MKPRVLSIQSTVVHGFCGNKAATFPLQLFGFDVCPINTVQFSNHTGYKSFKGTRLSDEQFRQLIAGLKENDLADFEYAITGYVGKQPLLKNIRTELSRMKQINPNMFIAVDPVMGDNGNLYVDSSCVEEYQQMVSMANLLTPNAFEAEQLTGIKLISMPSIFRAINKLHWMGAKAVVLTSIDGICINKKDVILVVASDSSRPNNYLTIEITKLKMASGFFVGTGDLFTALLVGWMTQRRATLFEAVPKTVSSIQGVLNATIKQAMRGFKAGADKTSKRELALLSDFRLLTDPVITCVSEIVVRSSEFELPKPNDKGFETEFKL